MVSCGVSGCINGADKNSIIITLVTIIMLLQLYTCILNTLAYLMPEAYLKPCQTSMMMRHIEILA